MYHHHQPLELYTYMSCLLHESPLVVYILYVHSNASCIIEGVFALHIYTLRYMMCAVHVCIASLCNALFDMCYIGVLHDYTLLYVVICIVSTVMHAYTLRYMICTIPTANIYI